MLSPTEALITLNLIPGLGSIRIQGLLEYFGTAELVLEAPASLLQQAPRIGPKLAQVITDWRNVTNVCAELDCAAQHGVRVVTLLDDDYPAILRRMTDPPIVLYVRGEWRDSDAERSVAIVGTREASAYGMTVSRKFGRELAEHGSTIISGLARGIDTAGHWGALEAGGRTIAVLGHGMSAIYPPENEELVTAICDGHGAVVSEFPMLTRPGRNTFPQRNRIVAAWSRAVLVTEAPLRSGSIHTAQLAAENYGNSIFAVPGNITQSSSAGCHALIRDGAILCTTPHELESDMGWVNQPQQLNLFTPPPAAPKKQRAEHPELPTDSTLLSILDSIAAGHDTLDALCPALGMGARELNPLLMRLQIQRLIEPVAGGRYRLCCQLS